ncbi:type VII secretion integral membrane protein EccD [Streptomyces sp. NPDC090106]|uniref:type VII secretion integral membrane protein EccD n=1 Tax=Streptomyces sp. NPDC090106 TaxID=3365946 RepID=UPI0038156E97
MSESSVAALCHLTVRAPSRTVDLALPADVPVADLLPAVLRYAGEELGDSGLDHGGWALQRLGGTALDDEHTLADLGLRDGEVLYLRPHDDALPEIRLDDLVDGIAGATRERLHTWTPGAGRVLLRGLVVAGVLTALGVLAWPGGPVTTRAALAGVTGLLLLAGSASASRAVGDAAAGATLGVLAAPGLALAGWLLPGGDLFGPQGHHVFGARLLAAGAAGAGAAVLGLAVAAVCAPLFTAVAVVAVAAVAAGALIALSDVSAAGAGAAVAGAAVALGAFVPALAFRLSGMRMPALPTTPQQLQEGIDPYRGPDVTTRTELASGWMTALYGATGVVCAGALFALLRGPGLPELLTAATLVLLLLLHGRSMVNVWQRLALVIPGAFGAVLLTVTRAAALPPGDRPAAVVGVLAVTAALAVASWTVPGRRMLPYWGRAAELLHSLLAVALLPLTLWVFGVFGALRALAG